MTLDIGKAFTFMFEDPEWLRKLVIGTIVALLGIVFSVFLIGLIPLIMLMGYSLNVTRNVMDGQAQPLPEWEDWGGLFVRGLKLFGVLIIWLIPTFILFSPSFLTALVTNGNNNSDGMGALAFVTVCCSCLGILYSLLVTLFTPAIYARLARTDNFASGFDFAGLWAFTRHNLSNVIIAILLTWLAGLIASIVMPLGLILCFVGAIVTFPLGLLWQMLVQGHLYGQVGGASVTSVEQPTL